MFVTKDKSGQFIWFEKGNDSAVLKHILNENKKNPGHKTDFEKAFGVKENDIPNFLKDFMSNGTIISNKLKIIGSIKGYERIYENGGKYLVITGIGTNGFIVSAYPRRK